MLNAALAILNAKAMTFDSKQPRAEAIAIYNGKIVAVGSNKEIRKYIGKETRVIDARGKTAVPGLVDCHVHMTGFGWSLQRLNLRNAKSIKEMQKKLKEYIRKNPKMKWILGGRWDQEKFAEKRLPTRWDLDKAVPDKPVFLNRVCGHIAVANSKALRLAKITRRTAVRGGQIDYDKKKNEPTGILRESAAELVWKTMPKPSQEDVENACQLACKKAVEAGLTGVHWIVDSADEIRAIQKLNAEGKLPLRVYLSIPAEALDELINLGLLTGFGNNMVRIGFIKAFADGSLGGHTAALKEPYADKPETRGILVISQKKLNKLVQKAHRAGLQLGIHAIGDHAVECVLRAFSKALEELPRKNHRHRIEHCSVLNPKLIEEMKRLGIVASVQPHFVVSDFWVADRVGKARARWVYPFKTLMQRGSMVASGSDCPVEPINPMLGVWAAVARNSFPEESLALQEALKTYTMNAAYASFDENNKGTITAGKLADITILSDNLDAVSSEKLKEVTVETVIVNGNVVYAKK